MMNKNSLGVKAAQEGDLAKAEFLFKQAYEEDRSNQGIFQNIIRVMQMRGDIDGLIDYYEQKHRSYSRDNATMNIVMQISEIALRTGRQKRARKILTDRAKQGDYSAAIIAPLSELLFENNELEQAKVILIKAIEINREDPSLLTNLAIIETELGNYQIADKLYKEVTQKRPNEFLGYYNYSKFKLATGNPDEANTLLKKANSIVPDTEESKELQKQINEYKGNLESELAEVYAYIESKSWDAAYKRLEACGEMKFTKTWLAAACELPENHQRMLQVNNICDPEVVVKCHQLLQANEILIQDLIAAIREESSLAWNRADKPTTGGYQTYELLKDSKKKSIIQLKKEIVKAIAESGNEVVHQQLENSLSGWGVILKRGGYQKKHTHTDAELSGVIYLQTLEESNGEGCLMFSGHKKKIIKPKPGMLVVFPSHLPHETIPYNEDYERICIAFNATGKLS